VYPAANSPRVSLRGAPDQITSKIHKNLELPVPKVVSQRFIASMGFKIPGKLPDERTNDIRSRVHL